MTYANSILDLVGNTPLVKLNRVTDGIAATVLVKLEYLNPGGSSKDRIATRIIDAAEREGKLKPGGTIVEPTSGNTGIGLALVAQQRGYRCVFVLPDKVGEDKRSVLTAYGAEIVVTPTAVAPESPESYYSVSDRLVREIPGAFKPDQYSNQNGPLSHYETTGPELWRDTDGRITHFVAGVGTGGTISGAGRYLKEVSDGKVVVIGADPEGSVYSGGTGRPYLVEGVGEDFWPTAYDPDVVDEIVASTDAESFEMTLRLAREEGMLVGGSSGMAVASALKAARSLPADAVMVVLLPDGGRGYLGKIFNERWMASHGFAAAGAGPTVADALDSPDPAALPHVLAGDAVGDALRILSEKGVSQLPILAVAPPVVLGEVAGTVDGMRLLEALANGTAASTDPVGDHAGARLQLVGINEPLDVARRALETAEAVLVLRDGTPISLLTRTDLRHGTA
ncbi:cystathionine beta-synthase [Cryobacterium mesophilum]|uniref:Cystathionine beta-synthase n=1 Tax=Terrimesophilobacter mesophilus TaxID=433647 RepID=A0A4R8VAE9_9MICO|nr:cystathionine beta-synthase [Terrimesophilobacter mesophilus]MBB5633460.1 cystathionine beta-synthase [Terrimesophilobacter mesophilus]TFB80174.1 cystathionine beta-synthase [Terrimesophilobacter mesophilus]